MRGVSRAESVCNLQQVTLQPAPHIQSRFYEKENRNLCKRSPTHVVSGIFPLVIATGGLGDGDGVCFPLRVLAPGGSEFLRFIPVDDSLLLDDVPTR